jgi:hypothetical protein
MRGTCKRGRRPRRRPRLRAGARRDTLRLWVFGPRCERGSPRLLIVASAVGVRGPAAALASQPVYFGGDVAGLIRQRPSSIHVTSDQNFTRIHWKTWGGRTAQGRGTAVFSASDSIPATPVALTLSDVRRCGKRLRYLRLRVAYGSRTARRTDTISYTCRSPS